MTEKDYIQTLLNSYLAAETTEDEERRLSDYFCSHRDIPNEWQCYSVLFRGMKCNHVTLADSLSRDESEKRRWQLSPWLIGVAAMIVILFGISLFILQKDREAVPTEIFASTNENPAPKALVEQQAQHNEKAETNSDAMEKPQQKSHRLAKSLRKPKPKAKASPRETIPVQTIVEQESVSPIADKETTDYTPSLMAHHRQMREAMLAMLNE